ncbi:MAG TPA: class I SAM-dependent methyltransferase [Candidatus Acidoferrum sp.]|nr:class I SAM-dependent methyltransferase [Candidatus Acidoferrum sp.]
MIPFKHVLRILQLRRLLGAEGGHEESAAFYNAHLDDPAATRPHTYAQSHYYFLWSIIVDRLRRDGLSRVLEIGCGPGYLAAFLFDQGIREYVGLDFSTSALRFARRAVPGARFIEGDARTTTIYTHYAHDVVICTEVLEHIEADLVVMRRFPPGKRCLCSVPNFPYEGHVRHFRDAVDVVVRYGQFFESLDVMTLDSPRGYGDRFFLFDGIRNASGSLTE